MSRAIQTKAAALATWYARHLHGISDGKSPRRYHQGYARLAFQVKRVTARFAGNVAEYLERVNMETAILDCGHAPSAHSDFTTGYGIDRDGKKHCYACCADDDRKQMQETGRITLYLSESKTGEWSVSNWPGSLRFPCNVPRVSRHNIARWRYDVWFTANGENWHGVQYGDNTQICHCRRTK